ncbi:hypothetical protein SMD20_06630 [Nonomuraea sp. LP-02]|uniref:hypothetical protein n=1 Tax=Nonomuraea sp. LP-02 TaxID=3097960 RepID=UPI002E30FF91|nr:hypothetical protein [Nonomuraea sp. LP-02]MED7923898.1 hypothetical protein [Nonomuraea sp. LP-02]
MVGGRMLMEAPALDVELLAVRKRLSELEEQVRTLSAANLALVRAMEGLDKRVRAREDDRPLAPTL